MLGKVRPTTAKVLESMVATLQSYWEGARVLDLFAGSGSLGRAALEAGASEVVFVEGHARVAALLRRQHQVIVGVLPLALRKVSGTFDIILGDPPYGDPAGPECLALVAPLLRPGGWVVWEHHHKDPYPELIEGLELWRRRRFGETAIAYFTPHLQGGIG